MICIDVKSCRRRNQAIKVLDGGNIEEELKNKDANKHLNLHNTAVFIIINICVFIFLYYSLTSYTVLA